ncbi:hypothetical protein SpCBS45565_g06649 [Spizellomyces sp. 'palustris']|nr:hypothetical protein SpCBS45565_g06649 [Spizellomyces sp. 'palustris']
MSSSSISAANILRLATSVKEHLSYVHIPTASDIGLVLVNGWCSTLSGSRKNNFFAQCARRRKLTLTAYDHYAHGLSSGSMDKFTIGAAKQDLLRVLDEVVAPNQRQILIGSSMGYWLSLLAQRERPERIAGIVGIGGAPNFTALLLDELAPGQIDHLTHLARTEQRASYQRPSQYDPAGYEVGWSLLQEGQQHYITKGWKVSCPVRLFHGMRDRDMPWTEAIKYIDYMDSRDVTITLIKDGNHRLSREQDLKQVAKELDLLSGCEMMGAEREA